MNWLEPLAVLVPVFGAIILFIRTLTDYWLRRKLIDKGLVNEQASSILNSENENDQKYASLKWGLIILFAGIGLKKKHNLTEYNSLDIAKLLIAIESITPQDNNCQQLLANFMYRQIQA